jgi:aminocarboxymuconate-semialdehyde decarboxylase
MAFADIPITQGEAGIKEMERALNVLGLHGISLYTNYDGKYLDAAEFRPFFAAANRLKATIFLHPAFPPGVEKAYMDYQLFTMLGFPFDTTICMAKVVYSGLMEQFPDINFILSHAGGVIPFLWWRIDRFFKEDFKMCRDHIKLPPSAYLSRCYYDTALTDTPSLMLTHQKIGDHIIMGTDRPYHADPEQTIASIKAMNVSEDSKAKIMSKNALSLAHNKA